MRRITKRRTYFYEPSLQIRSADRSRPDRCFSPLQLLHAAPIPAGGHDQSAQSSQSAPDASSSQKNEEYTLQGTLNQIDTDLKYLVLISDDLYFRFDFSESDADLSDLAPGDSITVTYTGPLEPDSEDVTAQLVSVTKDT